MSPLLSTFPTRLIPLCDGRPGLRGSIHVDIHTPPAPEASPVPPLHPMERGPGGEVPPGEPTESSPSPPREERAGERRPSSHNSRTDSSGPVLDFVSSDDTLDRYQEIITPAGWHLDTYRRNPVFQNSHQYGDILFTLGRAITTEVRVVSGRQALFQRIEFATEANPVARIAYALYSGKFLNTVSVGFIPLRWEDGDGTEHRSLSSTGGGEGRGEEVRAAAQFSGSPLLSDGRGAGGEGFRRRYLEQELLELSAVAIPANPNALALAYKSGALEKSDLKETADLLQHFISASPRPRVPVSPPSLLTLARQLRDLLRHA